MLAKVSDTQTVEHSSSKSIFEGWKNSGTSLKRVYYEILTGNTKI